MGKRTFGLAAVFAALCAYGVCADWPQFMGPNRDGISPETGLARAWPQGGPKVLWTFPLGEGWAGPSIRDGKVYVLDRVNDQKDVLRCLDFGTGKEQWNYEYDTTGGYPQPGSRAVPTVDETCVYAVGPVGDIFCVSLATHKPVWTKNLLTEFDGKLSKWAISQSPTLYGDSVIVAAQGNKGGVVALKKETGDVVWQSPPLGGGESYVTPRLVTIDGVDQLVMVRSGGKKNTQGGDAIAGIDAKTGKILWGYGGWHCSIPVPTATPAGEGRLFITGGYKAGSAMIKVEKKGDAFTATELFKMPPETGSQIHQPLLYNGYLYLNSNSNEMRDGMECVSLDGQVKWKTGRSPNFERGSLILADGMIFNLDGEKGDLRLIEPSPDGYKELASVNLGLTKRAWSPMALSNGKLVLRDQQKMMCLDVKAGGK